MRDVLVVLFWIWVLVALAVYGYRLYRRATRGPKSARGASAAGDAAPRADAEGGVLGRLAKGSAPPLPEGPIEARLPRSLQNLQSPAGADGDVVVPPGGPSDITRAALHPDPAAPTPEPAPAARPTTLAEALQGISMPADLLPVVQADEPGLIDGRRARFGATGTNIPTVAEALGEELRRLGYVVDGLGTINSSRAGLTATRGDTAVSATVTLDADTGAVIVDLNI